uniref:Uncharacterized protein n=1 Tax=Cynoglossus semilaevis TaxID=244447 RepID=A0A3P8V5Z6_CYNSE
MFTTFLSGWRQKKTRKKKKSIKCTESGCCCLGFKPGKVKFRSCDGCGHGWVMHALQKLQAQTSSRCSPVEVVLPGPVLDLSSLVLYGAQAVPVHLKILLDRLYSVLSAQQVGHILNTLGWSLGDYVRGYMLQSPVGKVLDCWTMVTPEEELLIIKQFLRFGETRSIVDLMTHHFLSAVNQKTCCLNTSLNIRSPGTFQNSREHFGTDVCHLESKTVLDCNKTVGHFENFPGGLSLLLPFHFSASPFGHLVPSNKVEMFLELLNTKPSRQ